MVLRTHQEEVFEGEGIQQQEMSPRGAICSGLKESLEIFFAGSDLEPQCEVRGMTVGHLVLALQRQLHLSEEDAEHIVELLGGDISAHMRKEVFVDQVLGWWESRGLVDEVPEAVLEDNLLEQERYGINLTRSYSRLSCSENAEDLHIFEDEGSDLVEMVEKLKLSKEVEEKWRRQHLEAVARCEFEEARRLETEETLSEVERICNQFKFQLEESREECQRKISEMEEENGLLRNELKMKELALKEAEDLFKSQICISPHFEKVARESEVLGCNAPSFGSVALEFEKEDFNDELQPCDRFPSVDVIDVASQTDLFAAELEGLKQDLADSCSVTTDEDADFSMGICSVEEKGRGGFSQGNEVEILIQEQVGVVGLVETCLEDELRTSILPEDNLGLHNQEERKASFEGWEFSSPICGKRSVFGNETSLTDEKEDFLFERGEGHGKPIIVDAAVNTDTVTDEKIGRTKLLVVVKSLLGWFLLIVVLFTTFGAVRVNHRIHLPSTWLLLYQLFGSSLPLPCTLVSYDSNPRPHIH